LWQNLGESLIEVWRGLYLDAPLGASRRNVVLQLQKDMHKMHDSYAYMAYPNRPNFVITITNPETQEQ